MSSRYIKKKIKSVGERLRLRVFRSNRFIYAQIIDDTKGHTVVSASSLTFKTSNNLVSAKKVGEMIATAALKEDITKVIFDRGTYKYHGRIKALADSAREKGLIF